MRRTPLLCASLLFTCGSCSTGEQPRSTASSSVGKILKTEEDWRAQLNPEQYRVLRNSGTERAFSGAYWNEHRPGMYRCAGCQAELFRAETKFDSGTGWPSFWQPFSSLSVIELEDNSFFSSRTEVRCARCDGHLGHVFEDGPRPTGRRYCMNSAALRFEPVASPEPGQDR